MGLDRPGITPAPLSRRPKVRAKSAPKSKLRPISGSVSAGAGVNANIKSPTKQAPAAVSARRRPGRSPKPAAVSLSQAVNRETAKVRAGRGAKSDTGDVTKGARTTEQNAANSVLGIFHGKTRANLPPVRPLAIRQSGILPGDSSLKALGKLGINIGKDVLHLPQTVVQSAYETAAAAGELTVGRPGRAKKLAKGIAEHDPLYAAADAAVKKIKGDDAGASRALTHAEDEISAHPGLFALEVYGAKGAAGKGVTRVQRRVTGKNPTKRAPAKFPNSAVASPRKFSDDAFQRAVDRKREATKIKQSRAMRVEAARLEKADPVANQTRITELRTKANAKDPRVMTEKAVKVRAARSAAAARAVTERNQAAAAKATREALRPRVGRVKRAARPTAAHTITAEAITNGTVAELKAYRDRLTAEHDKPGALSVVEQRTNREMRAQIDKAIAANHDPAAVRAAAARYKAIAAPLQSELAALDVLPKARANKAPLVGYAMNKIPGVVEGPKGPMRPETLADRVAKPHIVARQKLKALDAALVKARDAKVTAQVTYRYHKTTANQAALVKAAKDHNTLAGLAKDARRERAIADHAWKAGAKARRDNSAGMRGMVKVTAPEIRAHMASTDTDEPAFVSQRPAGSGSGGAPRLSRPGVGGATRTGRASVVGHDADPKVLVDTVRNTQRLVDLAHSYESHLNEFSHKPSRGKLTRKSAAKLVSELEARSGVKYVAVPDRPFAGDATLARTIDDAGGPDSPNVAQAVSESLTRAYEGHADVKGTYSIIPKAAADELKAQVTPAIRGPIATTLRGVSGGFRRAVLATSPSWFSGNLIEGVLRGAISGVRPGDKQLFNRIVAEIAKTNPRLADELRSRVAGGGHYQSADRADRAGILQQYEHTSVKPVAQALERFWEKSGPREAAGLWKSWSHVVFNQLSGRMESSIQSSMAGAALRHGQLIDTKTFHRVIKVNDKAVEQAAKGLTDTNEQAALGEEVARMYGRYDGFTADTRHAISTYTPFAAWLFNAANFVLNVLPRDHPTAVLVATVQERATRQIREDAHLDDLPDWLKGSIPMSHGRKLRLIRYTPFGAFTDPLGTVQGTVLPQFSGPLAAMRGEDWKGKKLRDADGKPLGGGGLSLAAAQAFMESTVPLYGIIKRVSQKGPSALNPLQPIGPPAAKSGSTTPTTTDRTSDPTGDGIDFSTYNGGGVSGIDFSGYGGTP